MDHTRQYVYDLIPAGTEKTLEVFEACAHFPHYERPNGFAEAMRTFLEANR